MPYRVALGIEYDGTQYHGWQMQPHAASIQAALNSALGEVAHEAVHCIAAGRTDTGVHASGQVVHFDTSARRSKREWLRGANSLLPDDICVTWCQPVDGEFHARFSATGRSYEYRILNRSVPSALFRHRCWWVHAPLDIDAMTVAASVLPGRKDFSSFRAAGCQAKTPVRELRSLTISRDGEFIDVRCSADAFLHHMVRNLVGSLVAVGRGDRSAAWLEAVLAAQDRTRAGITAPACGLTLAAVSYPPGFGLPPTVIPSARGGSR